MEGKTWVGNYTLALALLLDARAALSSPLARSDQSGHRAVNARRQHRADVGWVESDARDMHSFVVVCETLNLVPDAVRRAWRNEGLLDLALPVKKSPAVQRLRSMQRISLAA